MRFSPTHYVPFLKGKQGEYDALRQLSQESREALTPLVDVPRVPVKNRDRPLEEHLDKQAKRIHRAWCAAEPVFVDLHDLPLGARTSEGRHGVTHLCESLLSRGVSVIPVTGTERDGAYQAAVAALLPEVDSLGIRLLPDDIDTPSMLEGELTTLLTILAAPRPSVHLFLDLRSLRQHDVASCVSVCTRALRALSGIDEYGTLTVTGSSMPQSLGEVLKPNTVGRIRRKELDVWRQLQLAADIPRRPNFGDYGAVHPDLMDLDSTKITVAADIRYTVKNEMLIIRGASMKHHPLGFGQYYGLADALVSDPEYEGRGFSWGDDAIYLRARHRESIGTGNKTTWVAIATNHHLEFLVSELPALARGRAMRRPIHAVP